MVRLSKRLAAVAAYIPPGSRVCDVGTDHGLLPVYLAENALSPQIIATDIHAGPLSSAAALVEDARLQSVIRLCLCDGLESVSAGETDCVVIAGMGGENMAEILQKAPWTRQNVKMVLQPQSKSHILRSFLINNGYTITAEQLVEDGGRLYQILTAVGGETVPYTTAELYLGRFAQIGGDSLLERYFDSLLKKCEKAALYDKEAAALCMELKHWKEN